MGLEEAKEVKTPATREEGARGSKDKNDDEDDEAEVDEKVRDGDEEEDAMMSKKEEACYRSWTARLNYLAIDRPDIQFATKTCAKAMSGPQGKDVMRLTSIARYLKGSRR